MPLLAGLFGTLIGGLVNWIAQYLTKKVVTSGLAVAGFAIALTVLMVMFNVLAAPLVQAMFSTSFGSFIGLAFPPMAGTCLASMATCWSGCALYKLKMQTIKMSASA
jgi:uncharacterized membrane protein required for colicin V production